MHRLPYRRTSEIVLLVTMGLLGKPQQYNWAGSNAVVVCVALFAALAACEKNSEIKVYRVSKAPLEESAPQQQDAMPTNTAATSDAGRSRAGGGNCGDDTAELGSATALANASGKFSRQRR